MQKKEKTNEQRSPSALRDDMAIYRTEMANQRTTLAFLALSLHFFAFALTVAKVDEFEGARWAVIPAVVVGLALLGFGLVSHYRIKRRINKENERWNA
jgi:uncharacterized membrane protein YidH (DUF202 family)